MSSHSVPMRLDFEFFFVRILLVLCLSLLNHNAFVYEIRRTPDLALKEYPNRGQTSKRNN